MKTKLSLLLLLLVSLYNFSFATMQGFDTEPSLYTRDKNQVVWDAWIDDPLRNWTTNISQNIHGIINDEEITSSNQAQERTLDVMKWIINYFLWALTLIALVYILYHGFLMVTAAWDDWKYKKWFQWLRIGIIAIATIWVSWFIISLIFAVIQRVII